MSSEVDHLVVVCDTLDQGVAWCEQTLGATPGPGGRHALMGTHNRLLAIGSPAFPRAYLELIAIDPEAPPPGRSRWFGLDTPALRAVVRDSPRLHHVVLATEQLDAQRAALIALGIDPGPALAASRETAQGRLSWRILVREDGTMACDGALPTLIEWQGRHPSEAMAKSPLRLLAVRLAGLAAPVQAVLHARGVSFDDGCAADTVPMQRLPSDRPRLTAQLATPRGVVMLVAP